ncbi:MAG: YbjQ family protein [Candidatus Aenigmatarchaeota archaeon]
MIITTTDHVPGEKVSRVLGVVKGSTVRAKHLGREFTVGLKNLKNEMANFTRAMNEAREEALKMMAGEAEKIKADAIINVQLTTSALADVAEVLAYGTAVKLWD